VFGIARLGARSLRVKGRPDAYGFCVHDACAAVIWRSNRVVCYERRERMRRDSHGQRTLQMPVALNALMPVISKFRLPPS
jgi:hypothetical protein